jgi:hypothetical protein
MVDNECVLEVPYNKDAKNKVRNFYKQYYNLMSGFFQKLESQPKIIDSLYSGSKEDIIKHIKDYKAKHFQDDEDIDKSE